MMAGQDDTNLDLKQTAVRICPACGVVNPAGPSETCPHLQLVRFRSIDEPLEDLLNRMAVVRNQFRETLFELKNFLNQATRRGDAEVVPAHKVSRISDIDALRQKSSAWTLTPPPPNQKTKASTKRKQRKSITPAPVDPRQLALLIQETPKGDA